MSLHFFFAVACLKMRLDITVNCYSFLPIHIKSITEYQKCSMSISIYRLETDSFNYFVHYVHVYFCENNNIPIHPNKLIPGITQMVVEETFYIFHEKQQIELW